MDFKKATDELLDNVTLEDLARALSVSVQSVRQARAAEGTSAHRSPPSGWEDAIMRVAERRSTHYKRLVQSMRAMGKS